MTDEDISTHTIMFVSGPIYRYVETAVPQRYLHDDFWSAVVIGSAICCASHNEQSEYQQDALWWCLCIAHACNAYESAVHVAWHMIHLGVSSTVSQRMTSFMRFRVLAMCLVSFVRSSVFIPARMSQNYFIFPSKHCTRHSTLGVTWTMTCPAPTPIRFGCMFHLL